MRSLFLVVLLGCGGNSANTTPETPAPATSSMLPCDKVGEHVATVVDAERKRPGTTHGAVKELVRTRCDQDAWNDEVKHCLFAIKTISEGRDCATKMTEEQRTAMKAAARELRKAVTGEDVAEDDSSDWIRHVVEEPATK